MVLVQGPLKLKPRKLAWFQVTFTANGTRVEWAQAEHSRRALIQLLAYLQDEYGVPRNQTVIAGFSQGGIMSASVALTSPESVSGFGLFCARILPEIEPLLANTERLSQLQCFIAHGVHDNILPVEWAHRTDRWLGELGVRHSLNLYPVDHTVSAQMHADFLQWRACLE